MLIGTLKCRKRTDFVCLCISFFFFLPVHALYQKCLMTVITAERHVQITCFFYSMITHYTINIQLQVGTHSLIIHLRPEQAKQVARFNPLDEFWCYSWGGDGIPALLHKENGKLNIFVELDKLLESFRNKTLLFTFKNCTCKFLGLSAVNSNSCRLYEYGKAEIYIFPKTCQAVNQQFWLIINLKIYFTKNKTFCCRNLLKRMKEEWFFLFTCP